jgi:hypothetical protein
LFIPALKTNSRTKFNFSVEIIQQPGHYPPTAIGGSTQTLEALTCRLRLHVRGFYRDLDLLRSSGVAVTLAGRR